MIDFVRDPAWQFVGAILAVLAIIISIVLFYAQRKKKNLSYEIVSLTSILSSTQEVSGKLQILYEGDVVKSVYLLVIKLINTGNLPIISADYEREVRIDFEKSEKILSAEVTETIPDSLKGEVSLKDKSVILKPVLLNPGDTITIKVLISGFRNPLSIDGRIVGVKDITKRADSFGWSLAATIFGVILSAIGLALKPAEISTSSESITSGGLYLLGIIIIMIGATSNRRSREIIIKYSQMIRRSLMS